MQGKGGFVSQLPSLHTIRLRDNRIGAVTVATYGGGALLRLLDLGYNEIVAPRSRSARLRYLTLDNNALTSLHQGRWSQLPSLAHPGLSGNAIAALPEGALPDHGINVKSSLLANRAY
ncbi:PREDICTED: insulin-like growth factor-binding protein complex acid labile subunit, partial [Priapulus caudatus]|uniref:Insulin-like growth factor-binding protein complex acid labile subunit n=1 Tax=Priapulus caudatus TaxID=37621 RepID=A0ABM1ETC2_PRICU